MSTSAELLHRAVALLRAGDHAGAEALLRPLCAGDAANADALQLLALARARAGDFAGATRLFENYLERVPDNAGVWNNFANHLKRSDPGRAEQCYRRALALVPQHVDALYGLALLLVEQSRATEALSWAQQARTLARQPRIENLLGHALVQLEDLAAARAHFEESLRLRPGDRDTVRNLVVVLRRLGRRDEALALIAGVPEPHGAGLDFERAALLLEAGELDAATAVLERITAHGAEHFAAHELLDDIRFMTGRSELIGASLERGWRQTGNPRLLAQLALHYERAQLNARALETLGLLGGAVEADPDLAWCRARLLAVSGEDARAMEAFRGAHARFPQHHGLTRDYARQLIHAGEAAAAEPLLRGMLERDTFDQEAWAHLATIWKLGGDPRYRWLCDYERFVGVFDLREQGLDEDFLDALEATLRAVHRFTRHPPQQTLRGGTQTFGALFNRGEDTIVRLRAAIVAITRRYVAELPFEAGHPLLGRRGADFRFAGSWSVLLRDRGFHLSHMHGQGWLSSACYVALPPGMGAEGREGHLYFGRSNLELPEALDPVERVVRPERGLLVMFPSYFWHGTLPFSAAAERLTVAFDVAPIAEPPAGP